MNLVQIPSAVFCQPPAGTVGLTEAEAIEKLEGEIDVYVSKFKPMKNTISGRDERTLVKMLVHRPTDKVRVGVCVCGRFGGHDCQWMCRSGHDRGTVWYLVK